MVYSFLLANIISLVGYEWVIWVSWSLLETQQNLYLLWSKNDCRWFFTQQEGWGLAMYEQDWMCLALRLHHFLNPVDFYKRHFLGGWAFFDQCEICRTCAKFIRTFSSIFRWMFKMSIQNPLIQPTKSIDWYRDKTTRHFFVWTKIPWGGCLKSLVHSEIQQSILIIHIFWSQDHKRTLLYKPSLSIATFSWSSYAAAENGQEASKRLHEWASQNPLLRIVYAGTKQPTPPKITTKTCWKLWFCLVQMIFPLP